MTSDHPQCEAAELNNGSWIAPAAVHSQKYDSGSDSTLGGGHYEPGVSRTPGWQTRPGAEFGYRLRPRSHNWICDIMDRSQFSIHAVGTRVTVALVVILAFGLGWAGGSIFSSASNLQLAQPASKSGLPIANDRAETQAHHNEIRPESLPAGPKSALIAAKPSGGSRSMTASPASQLSAGRSSLLALLPANTETQLPRSPAPETRPTTIEGWSVRSVDGEGAVLVGPDQIWTVKLGDTVPSLGRIDTMVRWGKYWVVGTSSGIISSE
jgi:hypothetical protein